ncbi:hypothetical protein B0H94_10797 [Salsuginibacillus halophilus]|uniref:Uncharacterized protein n=1 Tax=Salsuginibacillus halophilus TaxID=517424 RepID=A0A2P8HFT6_9BACI|nr:hypothetical protein [Salsuginibacillus halophilus]PSL45092.1 hypothetical protein B0H94_10797 [Salsuginibacillus halophilus]
MRCPNCTSKELGKIGFEHYYCWNCFIEWSFRNGKYAVYQVEEDGSLHSLDDLFEDFAQAD